MKLPLSYTRDYFSAALFVSLLGHISYAAVSGDFLMSAPAFSVAQAPSSMEVIILNDQQMKKSADAEIALTIEKSNVNTPAVRQMHRESQVKQELKDIVIPEVKGALNEADAKRHKNPAPEYPDYARRQGWEGLVLLEVSVDRDGRVRKVQIARSSKFKILDEAASKTIRRWTFDPARMGGMALSSAVKIPVRFILNEDEKQVLKNP